MRVQVIKQTCAVQEYLCELECLIYLFFFVFSATNVNEIKYTSLHFSILSLYFLFLAGSSIFSKWHHGNERLTLGPRHTVVSGICFALLWLILHTLPVSKSIWARNPYSKLQLGPAHSWISCWLQYNWTESKLKLFFNPAPFFTWKELGHSNNLWVGTRNPNTLSASG